MRIVDFIQGTPEWKQYRREHFNASDAAAMLGISPYKTRDELIREYATGIEREYDDATLARFARGHELESEARPKAEELIGDELFAVVGEYDDDPRLSASFDGLTMDETIGWEHKTLNAAIEGEDEAPEYIRAQMEQQLIVSGAEKILFTASNETKSISKWYKSDPVMRQRIIDGWNKFAEDVKNWTPADAEVITPSAPESLGMINIQITGKVLSSNLDKIADRARAVLGSIKTTLVNDQDFADAAETVKWAKGVEDKLDTAKASILAQSGDINAVLDTIDELREMTRQKRLTLEKLVKSEKEKRRDALVYAANREYREHVTAREKDMPAGVTLNLPSPQFGEAIKGLKTLESMEAKLSAAVSKAKADADRAAIDLHEKIAWFNADAGAQEHRHLFPDLSRILEKSLDDVKNTIVARIAEAAKIEQEKEARRQAMQKAAEEAAAARAQQAAQQPEIKPQASAPTQLVQRTTPTVATGYNDLIHDFLEGRAMTAKERVTATAMLKDFVSYCQDRDPIPF